MCLFQSSWTSPHHFDALGHSLVGAALERARALLGRLPRLLDPGLELCLALLLRVRDVLLGLLGPIGQLLELL
jgi:hypothetical protein